jgi:predicted DNA-binding protein
MRNSISINIKEKLARKIYKLSKETNKGTSYHINRALESYIAEQEDLKTALKRLNDKNDKIISSNKLRKSLGV